MANFRIVQPILAALEGGLNRNPNDNAARHPAPNSGGYHTNKGITYSAFVEGAAKYGYEATTELFLQMPQQIVDEISKGEYWDVLRLDEIHSNRKAYLLFDWAFNSGYPTAIKNAQFILQIPQDGIAGRGFVGAVNAADETAFCEEITAARIAFIQHSTRIHESLKPQLIARVDSVFKKKLEADLL
jgi:lysozyme family protein